MISSKSIILLGFMCSGKTTLGQGLAQRLHLPFTDLDEYITTHKGQSITDMFADKGEYYFRQIESKCLQEVLQLPSRIIAAGGGTPCFDNNIALMNKVGTTVYLQVSPDELLKRILYLQAHKTRPLLQNKSTDELLQYIHQTLAQREVYYQQAHIIFPANSLDLDKLTETLSL